MLDASPRFFGSADSASLSLMVNIQPQPSFISLHLSQQQFPFQPYPPLYKFSAIKLVSAPSSKMGNSHHPFLLFLLIIAAAAAVVQGSRGLVVAHSRQELQFQNKYPKRQMIGSVAPTCTYNECRGCKYKCRAEQVPVEGNDPIHSAYHYKCVCHR